MELAKNNLRSFREKAGKTQEKLAEEAGVTRQTIISIETSRYIPSLPLALKFSLIFNCKVEDIFDIERGERK